MRTAQRSCLPIKQFPTFIFGLFWKFEEELNDHWNGFESEASNQSLWLNKNSSKLLIWEHRMHSRNVSLGRTYFRANYLFKVSWKCIAHKINARSSVSFFWSDFFQFYHRTSLIHRIWMMDNVSIFRPSPSFLTHTSRSTDSECVLNWLLCWQPIHEFFEFLPFLAESF